MGGVVDFVLMKAKCREGWDKAGVIRIVSVVILMRIDCAISAGSAQFSRNEGLR